MTRRRTLHRAHLAMGTDNKWSSSPGKRAVLSIQVFVSRRVFSPHFSQGTSPRRDWIRPSSSSLTARLNWVWSEGSTYVNVSDGFEGLVDSRSRRFYRQVFRQ